MSASERLELTGSLSLDRMAGRAATIAAPAVANSGDRGEAPGMITATKCFFEPLEAWARAFGQGDLATARRHAEHLVKAGELLAVHPDFRRCLAAHCPGLDPHECLEHFCQFLLCATDGRAGALQKNEKRGDGGPGTLRR